MDRCSSLRSALSLGREKSLDYLLMIYISPRFPYFPIYGHFLGELKTWDVCVFTSLQFFLGLPLSLLTPMIANLSHLLIGLSMFLLFNCPNYLIITSHILFSMDVTPTLPCISLLLILPLLVWP